MTMEPLVSLHQLAAERDDAKGWWQIRWQVNNPGADPLILLSARVPHGQFKADEQSFVPELLLPACGSAEFQSLVHCDEPAGLVTENAFVIFHCRWRGADWRIFIRIGVTVTVDGAPQTVTEMITTQKVGFSGISN